MDIKDLYQDQLHDAGLAPDSPPNISPSEEDLELAHEYIEMGISGLRLNELLEARKAQLIEALEVGQQVSINGVGYKRILPDVVMTDYFDGTIDRKIERF